MPLSIDVALEYSHDLMVRISDTGVGIDAAVIETGKEGHFGLHRVSRSLMTEYGSVA